MPKPCTKDLENYPPFSTATPPAADTDSNSDSSFNRSRFDSLLGFQRWLADNKLQQTAANAATVGSGEATRKAYVMEDINSSPLRRWKPLLDDDSPQATKKCRRGCTGCCRRTRFSPQDVNITPEYIEPWIWKGTTRDPRRHQTCTRRDRGGRGPSYDGGGSDTGAGESNTFKFVIIFVVIIAFLILMAKNKNKMQGLVKFGNRYFSSPDFSDVKVRVEGGVKDMIGSNFDDMSWKYKEDPHELEEDEKSFESAVEHNDPSVLKHIRSFEEQLKKKPSQFFPGGEGGGSGSGGGTAGSNKSSQFWSSMLN